MNKQARYYYGKGVLLYNGVRTQKSMTTMASFFEKAALLGHAKAMYALCRCYYLGIGVEVDWHKSRFWCVKAAKCGLEIAKRNLFYIDLRLAHEWCFDNIKAVMKSKKCGCFNCISVFASNEANINDEDRETMTGVAHCPNCGMSTVIPDASGYPVTEAFMEGMHKMWMRSGLWVRGNKKKYITYTD